MKKYIQRFEELSAQMSELERTKTVKDGRTLGGTKQYDAVDDEFFDKWKINVKNLLSYACGKESEHYKAFSDIHIVSFHAAFDIFVKHKTVFNAAKEDYLGGYCANAKTLVEAAVFTSQLEQAQELLDAGYYVAAAIIAGVVLETHLRELCSSNNISTGTMNRMNDDLAKAGIYSAIIQKQITGFAAIRNSAAHGKENDAKEGFNKEQVVTMVQGIENFLATSLN
ncbi:hypothetical protein FACS189476_08950 [Spirochaetia bacterium]|nr:hypothetical protein FACS189476_08950 [Spirochaetia bacterium]